MGADQSSSQQPGRISSENSLPDDADNPDSPKPSGSSTEQVSSPGPSSSSTGQDAQNGRRNSVLQRLQRMGSLVVVNPGKQINTDVEQDQMYIRLQQIPDFIPIIYNKDKISWSKEGDEIRSRLDPTPFLNIGLSFLNEIQEQARSVCTRQNELTRQIKDVDRMSDKLVKSFMERQRKFAKHAEHINKVNDLSRSLTKCQSVLNDCRHTIQMLNELLPQDERLEPFSWSEDIELVEFKN